MGSQGIGRVDSSNGVHRESKAALDNRLNFEHQYDMTLKYYMKMLPLFVLINTLTLCLLKQIMVRLWIANKLIDSIEHET